MDCQQRQGFRGKSQSESESVKWYDGEIRWERMSPLGEEHGVLDIPEQEDDFRRLRWYNRGKKGM